MLYELLRDQHGIVQSQQRSCNLRLLFEDSGIVMLHLHQTGFVKEGKCLKD